MRLWRSAISAFGVVAMMTKLRVTVWSGQRKLSQKPAMAIGWPSYRAMA
jgi:hypothetical protein